VDRKRRRGERCRGKGREKIKADERRETRRGEGGKERGGRGRMELENRTWIRDQIRRNPAL
jgi:hypothetical protein